MNLMTIHQIVIWTFQTKPHGGARGKSQDIAKVIRTPRMSVPNFMERLLRHFWTKTKNVAHMVASQGITREFQVVLCHC